jgi:two-component system, OmpR family, sensor histidine kinase KdpD
VRRAGKIAFSIGAVAVVTGLVYALRPIAPVVSLGVLYVIAVVAVAVVCGLAYAVPVSVASMLTFNFLFLPPLHTFALRESENWVALAVYLVTGVVVGELATRSRRLASQAVEAETLRQSDAVKTAVLRSVSHDLRSPITAIMAAGEVLEGAGETLSRSERDELLASISAQVKRLDRLVSNLLDLSRLEAGAASPVPELWTVDGLVARALDAVGPANERVDVDLPEDSPPVRVDPTQLEHVLVNLLENALKFSPEASPVVIRADRLDGQVVVRVIDHGPGIPAQEQAHIFDAFDRGGHTDGDRGSGLGLAIARGFAQLNGGRLWVESEPGRGSTFALALPSVETPPENAS